MLLQIEQEAQEEIIENAETLETTTDLQPRSNTQARFNVLNAMGMDTCLSKVQLLRIIIPRPLILQISRILKHHLEINKHPQIITQ